MRNTMILVFLLMGLMVLDANAQSTDSGSRGTSAALKKLKSSSPDDVMYAVQVLGASGAKSAVGPLTKLLLTGPRNDITNGVIQALGTIGHPHSIKILVEYLGHRRKDARVASIYALENYKDARVTRALEGALSDSDEEVRATAALSLGKRGNVKSVTVLFKALERGVNDAVISIGQLGNPAHAARLAKYLGRTDIKVLLPGFDEFLRRDDFPEDAKLAILNNLLELAGPDVKRFAVAYKASFPPGANPNKNKLLKKVTEMVLQIQED
jgi:HEAT repeat protein